jgi:hypothetical protein
MTTQPAKRLYFLWDYDLGRDSVRRILRGDNETERLWMMARIIESAKCVPAIHIFQRGWRFPQSGCCTRHPGLFWGIEQRGNLRLDNLENIGSNKILTIFGKADANGWLYRQKRDWRGIAKMSFTQKSGR